MPVLLALLLLNWSGLASASPVLSEFLAINESKHQDSDGDFSDWIEVHNPTGAPLGLEGYSLTDNRTNLTKWRFSAVTLNAGEYLVVFASGKNRSLDKQDLHTNFRLDGNGEYLALVSPNGQTVLSEYTPNFPRQFTDVSYGQGTGGGPVIMETPIVVGHPARYHVPLEGEPPGGAGWRLAGYDDASWTTGRSPFGFGYPTQPIPATGDLAPVMHNEDELLYHSGVYLRYAFQIDNPAVVVGMTLRMKYDDGFVAYLNGERVASMHAPDPARFDAVASTRTEVRDGDPFESFGLDFSGHLKSGENILAIHAMNWFSEDGDLLLYPELEVRRRDAGILAPGYFENPTPGAPNGAALAGFIKDTNFSVHRGFFDAPFDLEITSETPDVLIRYTTDGTVPTESHGTVYTGPIPIARTTTIQAAAFAPGMRPTNVDTQTYLFVRDVVRQRNTGGIYWDTEMDVNVVNNPGPFSVQEALAAIPTLSIVMAPDDLFGGQGIYSNATQRASDNPIWERQCSAEYFYHPTYDGPYRVQDGFQIDCSVAINGNFSRLNHNPKHSFRLKFKDRFGPAKLEFPLFPDSPVDEYDTITIRTGHNQGWATGHASTQMLRNQYARDIQGFDPTQVVAEGNHIHLYLNGQYWGLYNFHERPDDSFAAEHWGGPKEDYDGFKGLRSGGSSQARIFSGDRSAWSRMFSLADRDMLDPDNYNAVLNYVDADQLIDYMIGILYTGDRDGPTGIYPPAELPKNFYAIRRRHPEGRFRFFRWDSEFIFENTGTDMSERGGTENPAGLHKRLRRSPEYRLRFADRVHRYFFNGGAYTPEAQKDFYLDRSAQIDAAMVAESARWGDSKREPPFTREANWIPERTRIVDSWMPGRHSVIINQFKNDQLYPQLDAPNFLVNGAIQYAGPVPPGARLGMRTPRGTVYYTTDGSDPRVAGAMIEFTNHVLVGETAPKRAFMPTDPEIDLIWVEPNFDDAAWPSGTKGAGYETGNGYGNLLDVNLNFVNQIDPNADEVIYLRTEFNIADPSIFDTLTLHLRYDDGFVAYLNGTEVARDRTDAPEDTPVHFTDSASATHDDVLAVDFQPFSIDEHLPTLRAGVNVLAIAGLNRGADSSDFLLWPTLEAKDITAGSVGNVPSPSALEYAGSFELPSSGTIKARTLHEGAWSALNEAVYLVDSEPAGPGNLRISELNYRPSAPSAAEDAEDYDQRKDFEWVELMNVGPRTVDLAGVAFTQGIRFEFDRKSAITFLEPGRRLLVVKNREAFLFRNQAVDPSLIAGEYGLRFSDDGEEVVLAGANSEIVRFTYNDRAGWPRPADGEGPTLVLRNPTGNPDPALVESWRPSVAAGGTPGGGDSTNVAAWMAQNGVVDLHADPDRNGITHFMRYAYGGEFAPVIEVRSLTVDEQTDDYLSLTYRHNAAADDVAITVEFSNDLVEWSPLDVELISRSWEAESVELIEVRDRLPLSGHDVRFLRLLISTLP